MDILLVCSPACVFMMKKQRLTRDRKYKLYRTGEFYDIENDFYEKSPIKPNMTGKQKKIFRHCRQWSTMQRTLRRKNKISTALPLSSYSCLVVTLYKSNNNEDYMQTIIRTNTNSSLDKTTWKVQWLVSPEHADEKEAALHELWMKLEVVRARTFTNHWKTVYRKAIAATSQKRQRYYLVPRAMQQP